MIGGRERWEILEKIGAYAASELSPEEMREVEQLILEDAEALRLAESYLRMLAMLGAIGEERPEVPEAVISAFFRQAEILIAGVGRVYLNAFVYYLGLRATGSAG